MLPQTQERSDGENWKGQFGSSTGPNRLWLSHQSFNNRAMLRYCEKSSGLTMNELAPKSYANPTSPTYCPEVKTITTIRRRPGWDRIHCNTSLPDLRGSFRSS